jgi:hypothetical protein
LSDDAIALLPVSAPFASGAIILHLALRLKPTNALPKARFDAARRNALWFLFRPKSKHAQLRQAFSPDSAFTLALLQHSPGESHRPVR